MDTVVYELNNNLYINLTNKCSNTCVFCVRNGKNSYYGYNLKLKKDPTAEEVIKAVPDKKYGEVVFCGFGEPTYNIGVLTEVARELKKKGFATRINTNGQGNLINKRDITPELKGVIDKVNVSLNASDKNKYLKLCNPVFGEKAYEGLIDFAKKCKNQGIDVNFSIVDCIGSEEIEKCKKVADDAGITLKIREMIKDS